jgi:hypothetical protein
MPQNEPPKDREEPKLGPSEEVWRFIEEYANGLGEIVKKLRKRLN